MVMCVKLESVTVRTEQKPLFVLLHGTYSCASELEPFRELLHDQVEVVLPDLPGHGTRKHLPTGLARSVDLVDELIADAGEREVVLAGHSLGGFTAMTYAHAHPDRLAGVALVGCATEPVGLAAQIYRLAGRILDVVGPDKMACRKSKDPFWPVAPLWDEVITTCGSRQLANVSCPVLFLGGGLDQLHFGSRAFSHVVSSATIVTKPARTHTWLYTHPDEVAQEFRSWLGTSVMSRPGAVLA